MRLAIGKARSGERVSGGCDDSYFALFSVLQSRLNRGQRIAKRLSPELFRTAPADIDHLRPIRIVNYRLPNGGRQAADRVVRKVNDNTCYRSGSGNDL